MASIKFMTYSLIILSHSAILGAQYFSRMPRMNKFQELLFSKNASSRNIDTIQTRKLNMAFADFPSLEQCIQTMCAHKPVKSRVGNNTQSEATEDKWGPASPQNTRESSFMQASSSPPPPYSKTGIVKRALRPEYPEKLDHITSFQTIPDMQAVLGYGSKLIYDGKGQIIGLEAAGGASFPNKPDKSSTDSSTQGYIYSPCCSTREQFFMNRTMVDYYGKTRTIAQLNHIGSYQFIRHGICGNKGACPGECQQMDVTMPLVIHPSSSNSDVRFGFFKVPGYCICRIRSSSYSFLPDHKFFKTGRGPRRLNIH